MKSLTMIDALRNIQLPALIFVWFKSKAKYSIIY